MEDGKHNGAFCNEYGRIYLHVASASFDNNFKPTWIQYGITLSDAICIRDQLDVAISKAAEIASGRNKPPQEKEE